MNRWSVPLPSGEIGSFFATPDDSLLSRNPQSLPWEVGAACEYVATGRQALSAIARDLVARKVETVFLPAYLCESVLKPFLNLPLKLRYLPMTHSLQLDLDALERLERETSGRNCAVLMARYFGLARNTDYIRQITRLQSLGSIVVEDLTHSIFDESQSTADYTFASLRKLLPLASGATVTGVNLEAVKLPEIQAEAMWKYMDSKKDYLDGKNKSRCFYDGLVSESVILEATSETHRMDCRSFDLLQYLPYDRLIQSRRNNFWALTMELSGTKNIDILNKEDVGIATHLVVSTPDSGNIQRELARRGVYCPFHWPRPPHLPRDVAWKAGHFSVPIDHRYDVQEMTFVGSLIKELLA